VAASQDEAERLGIRGVPFYVIDGRYAISGAQPVGVFARALDRIAAEQSITLHE
jgi:predicted DsbA family dithiol-disulfide isomerase